jgi:hypothetical protein
VSPYIDHTLSSVVAYPGTGSAKRPSGDLILPQPALRQVRDGGVHRRRRPPSGPVAADRIDTGPEPASDTRCA